MKSSGILLVFAFLGAVLYFIWRRMQAREMPASVFGGKPETQAGADFATIAATMAVLPPNAALAWQAGDTISLSGTPSAGDFGVANKMLGTATPLYITANSTNP